MPRLSVVCAVLFAMCCLGCATIMQGTSQQISISSNPGGAEVTNNGLVLGKTPLIADLKRNGNHKIKIDLPGYIPYEVALTKNPSGWVFGNIIFGGIPGLVIDALAGGIYVLSPGQIQAEMRKQEASLELRRGQLIIAVTMTPDPSWKKIGQMESN